MRGHGVEVDGSGLGKQIVFAHSPGAVTWKIRFCLQENENLLSAFRQKKEVNFSYSLCLQLKIIFISKKHILRRYILGFTYVYVCV